MKSLLSPISIIVFFFLLPAQKAHSEPITKGLKAGIGISSYQGESGSHTDTKSGFNGGGFVSVSTGSNLAVQPEILFVMKGVNIPEGPDKVSLNYIEIPLLLKFNIPTESNLSPNFFAGPALGFLISAKSYFSGETFDIKDSLKSTDFGIVFGCGLDLKMSSTTLIFDIRNTIGLKDIDNMDDLAEGELKNNNFAAMIGLAF